MKKRMNGGKVGPRRKGAMKKVQKELSQSALAKRAERLFSFHDSDIATVPESYPTQPVPATTMRTYTTYSVCETPIPDPRK